VRDHGVVLESARGPVPSLAELIAGEQIRGSWWSHRRAHAIYAATLRVRESPEILVCRVVLGKITFVHERLWPSLLRCVSLFQEGRTDVVLSIHTERGHHRNEITPLREWLPEHVRQEAEKLSVETARENLGGWMDR
jgi:hypothetical protein